MSKNLFKNINNINIKTIDDHVKIGISQQEFLEYRAQKRVINELCNFIEKLGYTVKNEAGWLTIEKQNLPTEYNK